MDPKPKPEPHAGHCVVAMSGAYHPEGTDYREDHGANATPILLWGPHHDSMPAMVTPASVTVRIPTGGEAGSSSSEFSHEVIMLLIEAMSARWELYGHRERSRLFQSVQQELESHGYPLPVEKIRRKWNNLIVTYKRVKERCRGRGTDRTSWEYYEAMDTVLGKAAMGHGGHGSSASATLLGLATQNSGGLCDDLPPPSPGPSSGMYHSNLIGTASQVGPHGHPQHRATPPMSMSPAPFSPVPLVNAAGMYECEEPMAVAPQRPKVNSAPSTRRKIRGGGGGGGGRGAVAPYDRSNDGYGGGASQQQRHLLEEQRLCRQEARERRREKTANRVAESVGRMATALELICSKQDTIIALLQRMADKH
ncbi:uncharacterized protein si:ch1073-357b18.4 isoform X2 [Engraulis encrasicolus]|uniref:uncharacterized protein si:ch1073-357b18.4 isoform X2 n=1 Tax=Engraulis encrasicolus TaxID=184585 RepID=UPI002FD548D5